MAQENGSDMFDPERWGLPTEIIDGLADQLRDCWARFRSCFTTKTRDTSEYAYVYLRGLLTMDTKRNYVNIARRVMDPEEDGQNLQQFMSDSRGILRFCFMILTTLTCLITLGGADALWVSLQADFFCLFE